MSRRGRGRGYGGFLGPVINSIANAMAKQLLIAAGRKDHAEGGGRIRNARRLVQGKDAYGHKKERD